MSKEQIEVMAIVIQDTWLPRMEGMNVVGELRIGSRDADRIATNLYNAGYRKQKEGEWIFEFTLDGDDFYKCSVCGRQEVLNGLCNERNIAKHLPYCHCGAQIIDRNAARLGMVADGHNDPRGEDGAKGEDGQGDLNPLYCMQKAEVVRCKDCKHWCIQEGNDINRSYFCSRDKMWCMPTRKADDFCSYGERKE